MVANRPNLNIERVATGEIWYGQQAIELGLVDKLSTSDDVLMAAMQNAEIIRVSYQVKKNMAHKLTHSAALALEGIALKWLQRSHFWHR